MGLNPGCWKVLSIALALAGRVTGRPIGCPSVGVVDLLNDKETFIYHGQPKEVYVYVLEQPMRQRVHGDMSQSLLTREFLLAQRLWEEQQTQPKRKRMKVTQESWTAKLPSELPSESKRPGLCGAATRCEFTGLFRETFRRIESFELCELYLQGLLSETRRKNVEAMALKLKGPSGGAQSSALCR